MECILVIHLKTLLPNLIKPTLNKSGLAQATLILDWDKVIGQKLALYTMPLKSIYPKNSREGGTLHLIVHPAWALLVQQSEQIIIEQINAFYGYKAIEKLRLKQGYFARPEKIKRSSVTQSKDNSSSEEVNLTAFTHNPDLDRALGNLEKALLNKKL